MKKVIFLFAFLLTGLSQAPAIAQESFVTDTTNVTNNIRGKQCWCYDDDDDDTFPGPRWHWYDNHPYWNWGG